MEAISVAKRHLADLEELHNANRLVTVGTLTAGIAHELGTPLGVVLARAQMIVADESELAEARQDAEEIIRQVKRMTQMCREVLDFARPKPPTRDPVDLVQILRQMIVLARPRGAQAHREARARAEASRRPSSLGDPSKLMQIFTNLTINAAQAMPNGGTVSIRTEIRRVVPPAVERSRRARLRLRPRAGHRDRDPQRRSRSHLRDVLHDEEGRRRDRARPGRLLRGSRASTTAGSAWSPKKGEAARSPSTCHRWMIARRLGSQSPPSAPAAPQRSSLRYSVRRSRPSSSAAVRLVAVELLEHAQDVAALDLVHRQHLERAVAGDREIASTCSRGSSRAGRRR